MAISIKSNVDRVAAEFRRQAREIKPAVARTLNRIGEQARTETAKGVRAEGYNFSSSEIKNATTLSKANAGNLVVVMRIKRRPKSLIAFNARETRAGVTVKIKGGAKLIKGAFIAQRQNGVSGVFIEDKSAGKIIIRRQSEYKRGSRGGWHAYPCRKLYGPSVGGAFVNERFQQELRRFIDAKFDARLRHEVGRMFKGR